MSQKRYVVALSAEEREQLEGLLHKGKHSAALLTKVRIILKADAAHPESGWKDKDICEALSLQKNRPEEVRKQFVEQGMERFLTRKQRDTPPNPRIFDGVKEARLIQLACSAPPDGRARWTLELLANKAVALNMVDAVSDSTVGRVLKKTNLNRICGSNGSFPLRKTRPS
jgi:hypothetical protein